jgi:hypothetical protein
MLNVSVYAFLSEQLGAKKLLGLCSRWKFSLFIETVKKTCQFEYASGRAW